MWIYDDLSFELNQRKVYDVAPTRKRTVSVPDFAVLHHLRDEQDWVVNFKRLYNLLCKGGVLLVSDFIKYDNGKLQAVAMARWEKYLRDTLGDSEAERILASVAATDTPRSLEFQIGLLVDSGFTNVSVLHKENLFAAYCAVK